MTTSLLQANIRHLLCNRHLLDSMDLKLLDLARFGGRAAVLDRRVLKGKQEDITFCAWTKDQDTIFSQFTLALRGRLG